MTPVKDATLGLFLNADRVPFAVAPEHASDLAAIAIGDEVWRVLPATTRHLFSARVAEREIRISFAGLGSLWCLAFVAYQLVDLIDAETPTGHSTCQPLDLTSGWRERNLAGYVLYASRLMHCADPWPEDLSQPVAGAPQDSVDGRLNNLFYAALAWILLHEFAHIHHGDEDYGVPELKIEEEVAADAFATDWILGQVPAGPKAVFRALAITVAATWLLLHQRQHGPSPEHPNAIDRLWSAASQFPDDHGYALEYAAYILKAVFDPSSAMPVGVPSEEAFQWVVQRLVEVFRTGPNP